MMQAVIIANGEFAGSRALMELWQRADLRIAADGGSRSARRVLGLPPAFTGIIADTASMSTFLAVVAALLAGVYPAIRMGRMTAAEALRGE